MSCGLAIGGEGLADVGRGRGKEGGVSTSEGDAAGYPVY